MSGFSRKDSVYGFHGASDADEDISEVDLDSEMTHQTLDSDDDSEIDIDGFESHMSLEERVTQDKEHAKVYSADMPFANALSKDDETDAEETQMRHLTQLLQMRGEGPSLPEIESTSRPHTPRGSPSPAKKKKASLFSGNRSKHASPLTSPPATPPCFGKNENAVSADEVALVLSQKKVAKRQVEKAKLIAELSAAKEEIAPSKMAPPKKPIPEWEEKEVLEWLATIVERDSLEQWEEIIDKHLISGLILLGLSEEDLKSYTKSYFTISGDVELVAEGIRRLNIEGAKAGKRTLRRAIAARLGRKK
eukprot:m.174067 g.174067  ORF g.174067 m.174067 type:complete len:306 (-) comp15401_c0_seq2:7416-8333(-)